MTDKTKQFIGPTVGYARNEDGQHMVALRSEHCLLNTKTARELATDLLIWAERIDKRNKAEEEESHE